MNILTFDIEEWYLSRKANDVAHQHKQYNYYLDKLLSDLEARDTKATFFCLGRIAADYPQVIKRIAAKGHEIGCHSNKHELVNKMTRTEFEEDTRCAIDSLEQLLGSKIVSFRAPAFSIGQMNEWAFEVLVNNGIERDASVFPAARDFGGFAHFPAKSPCLIDFQDTSIKEFPICPAHLLGNEVVYSGGGYFRFFPYGYVKHRMQNASYAMTYFHLWDFVPGHGKIMSKASFEAEYKEQGSLVNRSKRFVKANLGKSHAYSKFKRLLNDFSFVNLSRANSEIDWANVPHVKL